MSERRIEGLKHMEIEFITMIRKEARRAKQEVYRGIRKDDA